MNKITEQKITQVYQEMSLEIPKKFSGSENNQKVAEKALDLCKDWFMLNTSIANDLKKKDIKRLSKSYIKDNLKKDEVIQSIILTIIIGVIIKLIVDWIVNNFIYNLKKE